MLGKLLKYDFRSMWKQFSVIWPAALILAFLNRFTMFGMDNPGGSAFGEWMGVISMGLFGGVCFTMVILSAVFVLTRFYKGLLGDEGYLMHTLPVKPWMLIVSKLTIGTIWFYLIDLLLVGAITLITLIALPTMAYFSPEDLLELRTMFQSYHTIFTVPSILFLAIPVMIIGSVFSLLTIYASISLGQLFPSHKVLASILCYLGLSTVLSTAVMLLTAPATAGVFIIQSTSANPMADFASIYWTIMLITLFANLVLCVPAFWICNYVMKRCLNLD